jgi:uncharacterized small protein (DUF1192 family)
METLTIEIKALTKQELYNSIGEAVKRIVVLEEEIPALEDQLRKHSDSNVVEALHEKRLEVENINNSVRSIRMQLRGRLEMELENVEKQLPHARPAQEIELLNFKNLLVKEIALQSQLIAK